MGALAEIKETFVLIGDSWQVYFHPVTRSAEVILTKILHRAKYLHGQGYSFRSQPIHFYSMFNGEITLEDYIKLDEAIILYYFQMWQEEEDSILRDLCCRFMNRNLYKYAEFEPAKEYKKLAELSVLFEKAGIDPEYVLAANHSVAAHHIPAILHWEHIPVIISLTALIHWIEANMLGFRQNRI